MAKKRSRRTKKTILKGKKRLLPDALGLKEYGFVLFTQQIETRRCYMRGLTFGRGNGNGK
jgi:hypothetical protein